MTTTALEHLSVELFYEIFSYFQFHEVFNIFSNLNSQFAAIINNMSLMPVYLGLDGMSISVTEFYYTHLSQSNVSNRLISLCVSDTLAIDDGLWLAEHLSTFINLRHLSLIDIKRSSFELMLNTSSINTSLVMLSVHYSAYYRAAYTFASVPEGAYYKRIFHLFPSLRICHLGFYRYKYNALDNQIVLPLNKAFMPIETSLLNLQSIAIQHCSLSFLLHILEHHPQLQELSFGPSTHRLPDEHPLMNGDNNRVSRINKRVAPNLRRLKVTRNGNLDSLESIDQFFERDVLYSLTKFTLVGMVTGLHILRNFISTFSDQCLYSLDVWWRVQTTVSLLDTNIILLDAFQQMKGRVPIELELSLDENCYLIKALTVPRIDKSLRTYSYLDKDTVRAQSRWPSTVMVLKNRLVYINKIIMNGTYPEMNDEIFSYLPTISSWHQITSLTVDDPLDLCHLRLFLSKMINLRTLQLNYHFNYDSDDDWNNQNLIDLLNDDLCNILMINGLQKLDLYIDWGYPDMISIASLIVKRLPHLQIIELSCDTSQVVETLHILMDGLPKLSFIIFHGRLGFISKAHSNIHDLRKKSTRAYRMEYYDSLVMVAMLYVWL